VGGGNPEVSEQILRPGGLGIENLFRYATMFGIGSPSGIELPGENSGRMPDEDWKRRIYGESWSTGDTYNAAFGQGYITVTPLQLANSVASIVNGGTLYQPTVIRDYLDPEGNIVQPFQPHILRNLNLELTNPDEPLVLLPLEDMIMKGENSLTCYCESGSPFFNSMRCDSAGYRNTVDIDPDPFLQDFREYRVAVPPYYPFTDNMCNPLRFDDTYTPPFVSSQNLELVRQGMRDAVTIGTAQTADLTYVHVAGKTGTAEYCDDIARPLGLCIRGAWPAHAWFVGYAPYENPEILIVAFVYNGKEGSAVALPVVRQTLEAYMRLRNERQGLAPITDAGFATIPAPVPTTTAP
jgi:penicillin-binding protein 2